ncbi:PP0621 family protein [Propionivibrio sp.]|uniref:PP0621 family protein n=1 Tax=Propionivibrio sp. TaxID=2212460 RepID=UPI003BF10D01
MKYFFLIALFFVVLWLWRKAKASRAGGESPPVSRTPESMVKCAHCGVNQPVSESILTNGHYYCCPAHRHEAESREP